jgi:hypothetical protein
MADNQFDILIRFGLSKEKATEAVNELKKIEAQTKITGTEGVKQEAAVTEATKKTFTSKKQLKDMVKQLGQEFPLLGAAGRLAMNPIVAATAAVTASFAIMKNKFDAAVASMGGVQLPDISEDAVKRYERIAEASSKIASNVGNISRGLSAAEKNRDILNAFLTGAGGAPDDSAARSAAAETAGGDSLTEAMRLRKISGNFNPNNAAANDAKLLLPELQAHRKAMMEMLNLISSVQDGSGGVKGSMKYLATFGLSNPDKQYARYQSELSQTDAQIAGIIAGGQRRSERGAAFTAAGGAERQAADYYEKAAGFSAAGAKGSGADFKAAAAAMSEANIAGFFTGVIKLAQASIEGRDQIERALRLQEQANKIRANQQ